MSIDRIIELETKLAFQEDTISQLNDVVCRQQDQLDELAQKCQTLISSTKVLTDKIANEDEEGIRPPHY
tara:strand:- start:3134 stop:3340 length:207 start_codon:yes stop_codon:yes gene_type:complete